MELLGAVIICGLSILVSFLLGEYLQERSERRRYDRESAREKQQAAQALLQLEEEPDRIYSYGDFALALAEELCRRNVIGRDQIALTSMLVVEQILTTRGEVINGKTREKLNILLES